MHQKGNEWLVVWTCPCVSSEAEAAWVFLYYEAIRWRVATKSFRTSRPTVVGDVKGRLFSATQRTVSTLGCVPAEVSIGGWTGSFTYRISALLILS